MERYEAVVRGRVQGVGYRYFIRRTATSLGLSGYVQNLADKSVLVLAEGPKDRLLLLAKAVAIGPARAHVSHVTATWSQAQGDLPSEFSSR